MILKFSEVLEIKNGKNQKKVEKIGGKYPIYGSGGIIGWADSYLCEGNNIIIGRKGNINKPIFVDKPFWNVDTAFGLISKEDILNSKYLYYFCLNYNFEKLNTTVTIPSLTKNNLLNIKINVPDLKKQEKIVKILDNIKEILLKKQNQISSLNFLSKCLFFEMFGDLEINSFNWKKINLKQLSILITKGASPNWQGYSYVNDSSQTLFITSENVGKGFLELEKRKYVQDELSLKQKRSVLLKEDFLINIVGASIGRVAQFNLSCKANINQAVALVRIKKNIINSSFLLFYLNSQKAMNMYNSMQVSVARANLSLKNIEDLEIFIPPIELQNKFAERIKLIEKSKFILSETLKLQAECTFLKQI